MRGRAVAGVVLVGVLLVGVAVLLLAKHGSPASTQQTPAQVQAEATALAGLSVSALQGCPPVQGPGWAYPGAVKITSDLYESYAVNYGCGAAASWTKKLIAEKIAHPNPGGASPIAGVPGFTCFAYPDPGGRAYAGGCGKGASIAFGWNWNLLPANVLGSTADSVLRSLGKERYQLEIQNDTGIGSLDAFVWSPPPGLTITALSTTTGGACRLVGGRISCTARLRPPRCLCQPGQELTVGFTASGDLPTEISGYVVTHGFVGARFRITAMTPLPELIPSALGESSGIADLPICKSGRSGTKKHPCV